MCKVSFLDDWHNSVSKDDFVYHMFTANYGASVTQLALPCVCSFMCQNNLIMYDAFYCLHKQVGSINLTMSITKRRIMKEKVA